jgi:hypothetical protein
MKRPLTDVDRWATRERRQALSICWSSGIRQIELDVVVAEVALNKLREIGLDSL